MSQQQPASNISSPDQGLTSRPSDSISIIETNRQQSALPSAGSHPSGSGCGMLGVLSQHSSVIRSRRRRALETDKQDGRPSATSGSPRARRSCNITPTDTAIIQSLLPPDIAREYLRMPIGLRPLGPEYLIPRSYCGQMNVKCTFCGALHFIEERSWDGHFMNCRAAVAFLRAAVSCMLPR